MEETILTVRGLTKNFSLHMLGDKTLHGCHAVSFTVKKGEFLGIAGPSGAGKSTIIKCIYRTYLPTSGSIRYVDAQGRETDLAAADEQAVLRLRRTEISYVSQFLKVIPRVSAVNILQEELTRRGWNAGQARIRSCDFLSLMGISRELWDAYPSTFSGGEQQRINLARALIVEPRLLLLDEPTASLDQETKRLVIQALTRLKNQGTSIIGIFHDTETMHRLADRLFTMQDGRCQAAPRIMEVV